MSEESRKDRKSESPKASRKSEVSSLKSEKEEHSALDIPQSAIKELPTDNSKLQTEKMEVHHHPQLEHKPKPWKEYLLEGLMIFLAVFMGFIAENIREHIADKDHEKQSMETLLKAVVSDTVQLHRVIDQTKLCNHFLGALLDIKDKDLSKEQYKQALYSDIFNGVFIDPYFKSNDAALQQLNTSGSLRLIRNQGTVDSVFKYTLNNKGITAQESDNNFAMRAVLTGVSKEFDLTVYKDSTMMKEIGTANGMVFAFSGRALPHLNGDKQLLKEIFNNSTFLMGANDSYVYLLQQQLNYGHMFITYLKKEYDLE